MTARVLVVDDSEFVRGALVAALGESHAIDVCTAPNGREALQILAENHHVQAVILDLDMPIVDGREFMRRLDPQTRARLFIVAVGNRDQAPVLHECRQLGADAIVTKPIDLASLSALLCRVLHGGKA